MVRPLIPLLAITLLAAGAPQSQQLLPVDEGPRDASFARFRQKLLAAARQRDRQAIWSIVDPRIEWSFGADNGKPGFMQHWTEARRGALEAELIRVLSLGGTFSNKGEFWAPYVFSRWPDRYDAFEYQVITGKNVNVRQRPSGDSPVVATLSYDIVKPAPDPPTAAPSPVGPHGWVQIITPSGTRGFVADQYIRSPIDYRAGFKKSRGRWRMTFFVAGD
jgi:hypothetical protein